MYWVKTKICIIFHPYQCFIELCLYTLNTSIAFSNSLRYYNNWQVWAIMSLIKILSYASFIFSLKTENDGQLQTDVCGDSHLFRIKITAACWCGLHSCHLRHQHAPLSCSIVHFILTVSPSRNSKRRQQVFLTFNRMDFVVLDASVVRNVEMGGKRRSQNKEAHLFASLLLYFTYTTVPHTNPASHKRTRTNSRLMISSAWPPHRQLNTRQRLTVLQHF